MNISDKIHSLPEPPGAKGLPFIGETIAFFNDPDFNNKRVAKYGKVYKTNIFGSPTIVMIGSEANTFLFRNENKYVVSSWPKSTRTLLGKKSLSVSNGSVHTSRRKLLYQAFQPRALTGYIPTMTQITDAYLNKWSEIGTLTWYPELRDYTFDIASNLFVSTEVDLQTPIKHYFEDWCAGLFTLPISLPWTKFGKALKARKKLLKSLEQIIRQRQQADEPGEDALGLLIQAKDEAGNGLSLEELKDQILVLLFAGHETLTSAIASFCFLTAQHPDVLAKLRAEQANLNITGTPTLADLQAMTYLEQVLKEVMRLIPPVGGGFRAAIATFEFAGYRIPKGWNIQYQIAQTHQDKDLYPESDRFNPDRFAADNLIDKSSFGYIPFGGGLRECIGKEFARLEMRLFASKLLQHYQWELIPDQNLDLVTVPTPHPRDGLKVNFSRR
ncbi:cytochrome P450 [Pleurocapsa sp. CCALA 161]|uniref:cytochrome P450 n=1 Tax=Pleurocapsa sp. CCALA 161 TaxID=2107688 RepID=UPI0018EDF8F0|nr:cytochrome P450 [Pleurocapsa sp. CCALA 161]